ncbi:MAG: CDGSH iron-sulfur domain-containing protein [Phycisphaerales bacterium]
MPRYVRFSATGPVKIEPGHEKPVFVCACGLSQKFPLCDGSHKGCPINEPDPAATYIYDEQRKSVVEVRPPKTPD